MIEKLYDNSDVRRQDRVLDFARAKELLATAEYGVLSMTDENGLPYGVPLNYVWDSESETTSGARTIYIHCAMEGKKLRAITQHPDVSFCIVGNVKPQPENLTTLYESIIVRGKASTGLSDDERRDALRLLARKFAPAELQHAERSIAKSLPRTEIIRLDITSISGKAKRPKG